MVGGGLACVATLLKVVLVKTINALPMQAALILKRVALVVSDDNAFVN